MWLIAPYDWAGGFLFPDYSIQRMSLIPYRIKHRYYPQSKIILLILYKLIGQIAADMSFPSA
jgi:hypothetical protein